MRDPLCTYFPSERLEAAALPTILANWSRQGEDIGCRFIAQAQVLAIACLAACRPGPSGRLARDFITSALLEEIMESEFPVPSFQLAMPPKFRASFDVARLTCLLKMGRYAEDDRIDEIIATIVEASGKSLSGLLKGCNSFGEFLRKKSLANFFSLGAGNEHDFPGVVTRFTPPIPNGGGLGSILVIGGCDLVRIVNAAQYTLLELDISGATWWEDFLRIPSGFYGAQIGIE